MVSNNIFIYYMEILIILIIILFKLLLIKNEYLTNKKHWLNYRLGDIIIGECYRKSWERQYFNSIEKLYPNSIAAIYIKKTNHLKHNRFNNMNILDKIVRDKTTKNNIPGNDKIVIHLRIGDSLKDYKNGKIIYNKRKRFKSGTYAIKVESFEHLIDYIKKNIKNKKIVLVYGSHKKNERLNNIYLNEIKKILKVRKLPFIEKLTGNPDDDFIYMANSKYFFKSNGTYSDLISNIVRKNGGIVVDTNNF